MKAKELISELQKLVDENGDLEVDFVCSFLKCSCNGNEYCYCTSEEYEFGIESVSKKTFPQKGKMTTVGFVLMGDKN